MRIALLTLSFLMASRLLYSQSESIAEDTLVYFLTPQMPVYYGDYDQSLENVLSKLDRETITILKSDTINVNIQISGNAKVVITTRNYSLPDFEKILEEHLNKLIWFPGKNSEKNVTVQSTSPVRIIDRKLTIPLAYKEIKGNLIKCKILDNQTNEPIPNVRLQTKYNQNYYNSDKNGEVSFYSEPNEEIAIIHLNYLPITFKIPENKYAFQIKLNAIAYELNSLDLTKYSPIKLPYKNWNCTYENWKDTIITSIVFMGSMDNFKNSIIRFRSIVFLGIDAIYTPEEAEFNCGMECFYNYLCQNFLLPEQVFKNGDLETVDISFAIAEDGSVIDMEFPKSASNELISSLKTVFLNMPKWKPATQVKVPVKQFFTIKLIVGKNKYWEKFYG